MTTGWPNALITFFIWICIMTMQHFASKKVKTLKLAESKDNDERQKLVTDMVIGARTIKTYGWENHYFDKIK